jgi:hypothetical protein
MVFHNGIRMESRSVDILAAVSGAIGVARLGLAYIPSHSILSLENGQKGRGCLEGPMARLYDLFMQRR